MIGTSDGEQFNTPFEHAISASTMPPTATEKPTGELKTNLGTQVAPDSGLPSQVQNVLSQPHIQAAIANPKIDRTHDVPYVAGASAKPDDFTTHVDQHIPTTATISGKTFDPAIPLNIHEQVEREVMNNLIKRGMTNEKAYEIAHHEFAEPAEDAWYKSQGIDVKDVNHWWDQQNKVTEKEKSEDLNFPKDLYKKPYPHDEVEGTPHTPSNTNSEWAMSIPLPKSRPNFPYVDDDLDLSTGTPRWKSDSFHYDSKYDKLPMSDNVEDKRKELSDIVEKSKTMDELINNLNAIVHIKDPFEAEKYFRGIKSDDMSDSLSRKSGIVDLLHQLRVLNDMDKPQSGDLQWLKDQEIKVYDSHKHLK